MKATIHLISPAGDHDQGPAAKWPQTGTRDTAELMEVYA